jgi:hypothetical protein
MSKSELLAQIAASNRGISTTPEQQQSIARSIADLESVNPYPRPLINGLELLAGNWRLVYTTSNSLLGIDRFPLINLGEIYQYLDPAAGRLYNVAEVDGWWGLKGVVVVGAAIEIISDCRVGVRFNRSVFGLQNLMNYGSVAELVTGLISNTKKSGAMDFALDGSDRGAWLDITYLDADLRIGRGNEGNVFLLVKS